MTSRPSSITSSRSLIYPDPLPLDTGSPFVDVNIDTRISNYYMATIK